MHNGSVIHSHCWRTNTKGQSDERNQRTTRRVGAMTRTHVAWGSPWGRSPRDRGNKFLLQQHGIHVESGYGHSKASHVWNVNFFGAFICWSSSGKAAPRPKESESLAE